VYTGVLMLSVNQEKLQHGLLKNIGRGCRYQFNSKVCGWPTENETQSTSLTGEHSNHYRQWSWCI